jgi:outer membrane receptor protein involved in Fe transport
MQHHTFKLRPIAVAVSLSLLTLGSAWAQTAANAPVDANKDGMKFDQIVVTGTATRVTKKKSSVSVSTLDSDEIQMTAPTNAAEVLRAIPGVHSESSAGEGNTNLTVRGLPISAGGSRYVQWAEDGLPVLQSGDYNFVTPDMFLKVDNSLDRVEVVRGGSASVLGSNSPGGILNFITKTGEVEGGSIGISKGTGNQTRYDVDYGAPLSDKTRFFIGAFYRTGDGPRNGGIRNAEDGGQIKANITHELGDGNFIRASFKHLDDKTPLIMPVL